MIQNNECIILLLCTFSLENRFLMYRVKSVQTLLDSNDSDSGVCVFFFFSSRNNKYNIMVCHKIPACQIDY